MDNGADWAEASDGAMRFVRSVSLQVQLLLCDRPFCAVQAARFEKDRKEDEMKRHTASVRKIGRGLDGFALYVASVVKAGEGTFWLPAGLFDDRGRLIPPLAERVRALLQGKAARAEHPYERARADDDRKLLHQEWWTQAAALCRPSDSVAPVGLTCILAAKETRKYFLADDPWLTYRQADLVESVLNSPLGHQDQVYEHLMALVECELPRVFCSAP